MLSAFVFNKEKSLKQQNYCFNLNRATSKYFEGLKSNSGHFYPYLAWGRGGGEDSAP